MLGVVVIMAVVIGFLKSLRSDMRDAVPYDDYGKSEKSGNIIANIFIDAPGKVGDVIANIFIRK